MRPSLVAQSPGSGGSKRAVRWVRSRLGLVTVPLGPRSLRSGLRKPGSWSSRSSCCSSPAWRAKARVCAGSRSPSDERRAAAGLRRLRAGGERQVGGVRPTGSAGDAKRDAQLGPARRQHGGAVAQRAAPGACWPACGERWASSGLRVEGDARAGVGGQAREALVEGRARVAWPTGRRAPLGARARSAGARRDDDHAVARARPPRRWSGRGAGASVAKASHALPASIATAGAPADERVRLVGGQRAVRDARRELLDRQRHERLARVEVEDDVGRARRARRRAARPGSRLRASSSPPPRSSTTAAAAAATSASAASSSGARRRSTAATVAPIPRYPDPAHHGEIAQLVEHTTENRGVPGSSPGLAIPGCPAHSRYCRARRYSSRAAIAPASQPDPSPFRRLFRAHLGAVKLHTGVAHDGVEAHSMLALHALLELRVDVERHLRVGVPDLAHDPLDVEAIGQQSDGDVGPPQACAAAGRPAHIVIPTA